MQCKDGVILAGLDLSMRKALIAAEKIWKELGRPEGVTITSALDGVHSAGSLHYYGFAIDLRTRYFTAEQKVAAAQALMLELPVEYEVIMEPTHIHIEYDPK